MLDSKHCSKLSNIAMKKKVYMYWERVKCLPYTRSIIKIVKYTPINDYSYILIPEIYRPEKYELINIHNMDNKYFQYCIARHFSRDEKYLKQETKRLKAKVFKQNWNGI